ncbi:MAG: hypothetical protein ACE5HO_19060 [bacterium]
MTFQVKLVDDIVGETGQCLVSALNQAFGFLCQAVGDDIFALLLS